MDHLAREIALAAGERTGLAVALIDIDHFKKINDSFGHAAGDAVLCGLAAQLAGQMRATDRLGRYGGEEMLAILPGLPPESPSLVVERLRAAIAAWRTVHNGVELSATASFGVAWLQPPADTPEALIERADAALYAAKHGGRNRVSYAAPLAA
jgi:diguanylate cyclase (GGDEF)-like protein